MWRRDETLDPAVARELEALDRALAGEPVDDELADLVRDVRAERPELPPALRARLDESVAAGFPRPQHAGRRPARRRSLVPALGIAATLLVGLVVIGLAAGGGDSSLDDQAGSSSGGSSSAESAPAAPEKQLASPEADSGAGGGDDSAAGGATGGAPQPSTTIAPQPVPPQPIPPSTGGESRRDRRVERSAQLTLSTGKDGVQDVANGVVRTTQSMGGFVQSSQIGTTGEGGAASFILRVPSARLDDALRRLSALADVASLQQASEDITSGFVSAEERLSDARAERRALLRALGRADTDGEIAALRERLRANRSRIAALKGELNALRRRASFATVEVAVDGSGAAATGDGGDDGAWTPTDAWEDALRVLEVAAGVALIALAVLMPLGILGLLAALATRAARRRRREAALDVV